VYKSGDDNVLVLPASEGWFALDHIDLTGVRSINVATGWQTAPEAAISFELRLDAPDGKTIGKGTMPVPSKSQKTGTLKVPVEGINDNQFHAIYFVYKSPVKVAGGVSAVQFNAK
jgi:cytochrome c